MNKRRFETEVLFVKEDFKKLSSKQRINLIPYLNFKEIGFLLCCIKDETTEIFK